MARDLIQIYRGDKDNADTLAQGELFLDIVNEEITLGGANGDIKLQVKKYYKEKQSTLYAEFYQKLANGTPTTLACVGDSITYGLDKTSVDIRPAKTGTTDTGIAYNSIDTLASITYPERLQTVMDELYNVGALTVINKGYSGHDVGEALTAWNITTDMALISFGINDAINSSYAGEIDTFLINYRKLIEKHLKGDCGVIIMTPTKLRLDTDIEIRNFRNAIYSLANEYGIPVIKGEEMLSNIDYDFYSDSIHLTGEGYKYLGSRIASLFIANGPNSKKNISSKDSLMYRTSNDSIINKGGTLSSSNTDSGTPEGSGGFGVGINLTSDSNALYFSFYTCEDNLAILPYAFAFTTANMSVELDFGEEVVLPSNELSLYVNDKDFLRTHQNGSITYQYDDNKIFEKEEMLINNQYLYIPTKGWHTIKITRTVANVSFQSIEFMSLEDAIVRKKINNISLRTHTLFNDTNDVTSIVINVFDYAERLNLINVNNLDLYWENSIMKIKSHIFDRGIIEYWLQLGNLTTADSSWKIYEVSRVEFVATPTLREISSVSYDNATGLLTLNFTGSTTKATEISFSA